LFNAIIPDKIELNFFFLFFEGLTLTAATAAATTAAEVAMAVIASVVITSVGSSSIRTRFFGDASIESSSSCGRFFVV
jgi:hypothetical protein